LVKLFKLAGHYAIEDHPNVIAGSFLFIILFISFAGFTSSKFSFKEHHKPVEKGLEIRLATLCTPADARKWWHTALSKKYYHEGILQRWEFNCFCSKKIVTAHLHM
jgi:hypothetical protein